MTRRWTQSEDDLLRGLVQRHGDQRGRNSKWNEISKGLPGRSNKDCRKRWFHSLDPSLRKGRWTKEEDRALLEAHQRLGPAWKEIALLIPGRKDDQCAKRYNDVLNPSVKHRLREWTAAEDQMLSDKVAELGHAWSAISALLPGRPPLTCRNRWRKLSKSTSSLSNPIDTSSAIRVSSSHDSVFSGSEIPESAPLPSFTGGEGDSVTGFMDNELGLDWNTPLPNVDWGDLIDPSLMGLEGMEYPEPVQSVPSAPVETGTASVVYHIHHHHHHYHYPIQ